MTDRYAGVRLHRVRFTSMTPTAAILVTFVLLRQKIVVQDEVLLLLFFFVCRL